MAPELQRTINKPTDWIGGASLDCNSSAYVRFSQAEEQAGIVFVRTDLPGHPEIPCHPDYLQSMPRWTALARDGIWVHHTEHVLAAVAFCGLDNVRIEMKSDRLPMTSGGTCKDFVDAITSSGLRKQSSPRLVYRLRQGLFHLDGQDTEGNIRSEVDIRRGRYIAGMPGEGYSVSTVFEWPHLPGLPVGVAETEVNSEKVDADVVSARSYLVDVEREQVKALLGPVQNEVMQLYPGCLPEMGGEAARHKIVDFVGDLMVLGYRLQGHFFAFRAGHRIHHDFLKLLLSRDVIDLVPATRGS